MILTPDRIRTEKIGPYTLTISEKIIPETARSTKDQTSYCKKGDPVKPMALLGKDGTPLGICIHNTGDIATPANTDPAEQYTRATWPNCNMAGTAVHFYVYDNSIWQNLRESECGWHAGDGSYRRVVKRPEVLINGNLDTIAIECIGDRPGSEETSARLCAYLLKKYNLDPKLDLYTHHDFSPSKTCPLYILPHWDKFFARVTELMAMDGGEEQNGSEAETADAVFNPSLLGKKVYFTGGYHYPASNDDVPVGGLRKSGTALCTKIAQGAKHPYHLKATEASVSNVYGWVDLDTVYCAEGAVTDPGFEAEESRPAADKSTAPKGECFPATPYTGSSLVDGLRAIGADSGFSYRARIAEANSVFFYTGTALQNLSLLAKLKAGTLLKP